MNRLPETPQIVNLDTIYIYGLVEPTTKEIKYIGQSKCVRYRYKCHLTSAVKGNLCYNWAFHKWIKDLIKKRLRPILIIIEETDNEHCFEREDYWIDYLGVENLFNRNGKANYNMPDLIEDKK